MFDAISQGWNGTLGAASLAPTYDGRNLSGSALLPYMQSLDAGDWRGPSFSMGTMSNGPGMDSSPAFFASGNQGLSLHDGGFTSDLSSYFKDTGIAAPDWNSFYHPEKDTYTTSYGGTDNSSSGYTMRDDPLKSGAFDSEGAAKAYYKYQSDIAAKLGLDPTARYAVSNQDRNPTGGSATDNKNNVNALYKLNSDTNQFDPIWGQNYYNPSSWVQNRGMYGSMAAGLASVLTAGAASGAFGALGGAEAGGAVSGMDLAADAGMNGANSIYGAAGAWDGAAGSSMATWDAPQNVGGYSNMYPETADMGSFEGIPGGGGAGGGGLSSEQLAYGGLENAAANGGSSWYEQALNFAKQNPGLVNAGGGLVNGLIGAYTSNKALDRQTDATNKANALWEPYRQFGIENLGRANGLLRDPSSISKDPAYQFTTAQGVNALDRSAASKGGLYSGAQMKAQTRFGQENANTYMDRILGRYTGAAQLGATGTTNISNNLTNLGQAGAGAAMYQGNVLQNGVNNALGQWNYANGGYGQPWNKSQYPGGTGP